jgi:hypothetical protein
MEYHYSVYILMKRSAAMVKQADPTECLVTCAQVTWREHLLMIIFQVAAVSCWERKKEMRALQQYLFQEQKSGTKNLSTKGVLVASTNIKR